MEISIIIPVYNAGNHLSGCLESLILQDFNDFEILLINDGSTDDSLSIIESYATKYEFISYVDKKNEGVAITRNLGISIAKGTYIMFVDNDDFVDKDYLKTYYELITSKNCDVVCGGYRRVTDERVLFESSCKVSDWFKYTVTAPWAKIYRRDFLLQHKLKFLDYPIGEDVYFNLQVFDKTKQIYTTNYIGYNWYFNDNSISNTSQRGFNKEVDILHLLDLIDEVVVNKNDYIQYFFYRYVIWYLLFSGRKSSSKEFILESKRYFNWLDSHGIRKNISVLSNRLNGETLVNRVSVGFVTILLKLHLVGVFAKFYCKGE